MKTFLSLFFGLFMALITTCTFAQHRPEREKIKALKIAHLNDRLELSAEEAKAFWPVYDAFEKKIREIRRTQFQSYRKKIKNSDNTTDAEAQELFDNLMQLEINRIDQLKKYFTEFSAILGAKRALIVLHSEEEFKRKLLREYGRMQHKRQAPNKKPNEK
jgi:hypothetical protein